MKTYQVLHEHDPSVDIRDCLDVSRRFFSEYDVSEIKPVVLPDFVYSDIIGRSYGRACDSGRLEHYLKMTGVPDSILILRHPLLADEFSGIPFNIFLALGTAIERTYAVVSAFGMGTGGLAQTRAAKVLAHEMAHVVVGIDDGCCQEQRCIMYNSPVPYVEMPDRVLKVLDGKSGWCDFHSLLLFGPSGRI